MIRREITVLVQEQTKGQAPVGTCPFVLAGIRENECGSGPREGRGLHQKNCTTRMSIFAGVFYNPQLYYNISQK